MKFRLIFTVLIYLLMSYIAFKNSGTDGKNMMNYRLYPDEVQKALKKDDDLKKIVPDDRSQTSIMLSNFIIYAIIFGFFGIICKRQLAFNGYLDAFVFFLVLGETLNLYDLLVIDLLWWRNSKRIRFSILQNKDAYQNPKKHLNAFLWNVPLFIVVALFVSLIVR